MTASDSASTSEPVSPLKNDALVTEKSVRLSRTAPRCSPSDYETDDMLRHMTKTTRWLGRTIPLKWQHKFRDGGGFRWLADSMVTSLAIPLGAITCPSAAKDFLDVSKNIRHLNYGDHESQFIEVFLPVGYNENFDRTARSTTYPVRGMVFFCHGGAWGSGKPWYYRLAAKPFLEVGLAVAIVGYRVYPLCGSPGKQNGDRGGSRTQIDDLDAALRTLAREYPEWCDKNFEDRLVDRSPRGHSDTHIANHIPHLGTIVVAHSSGAHISMLWMVENLQKSITKRQNHSPTNNRTNDIATLEITIDAFVGVSGVYNIGHHFDYEAGRGVEEISPLKPANGYDRQSFAEHSPPWKVQHELIRKLNEMKHRDLLGLSGSPDVSIPSFPNRMLLLHGAEDDVVPFPTTSDAAKLLKQCLGAGSSSNDGDRDMTIDECYIPNTGHQDAVVDLMMLRGRKGPVTSTMLDWLINGNRQLHLHQHYLRQQSKVRLTRRSKL